MRYLQGAVGTLFGLSAATLVVFLTVKGTKPTGSLVLPVLSGVLVGSALIWLVTEKLKRDAARSSNEHGSEPLTSLEQWLQQRIRAAGTIERQRPVRGDRWYLRRMEQWDAKNAFELMLGPSRAPELVERYRAADASRPEQVDGVGPPHDLREYERYYCRRLDWLERTFEGLRKGT
jgi:hypothetical protein